MVYIDNIQCTSCFSSSFSSGPVLYRSAGLVGCFFCRAQFRSFPFQSNRGIFQQALNLYEDITKLVTTRQVFFRNHPLLLPVRFEFRSITLIHCTGQLANHLLRWHIASRANRWIKVDLYHWLGCPFSSFKIRSLWFIVCLIHAVSFYTERTIITFSLLIQFPAKIKMFL